MQYAAYHADRVIFESDAVVEFKDTELSEPLIDVLQNDMNIKSLFQMQNIVLSHVLRLARKCQAGDVVLCAPTGSGKTLAYALPIVQALATRVIPRLRAVVVVPTRDLAMQVTRVFKAVTSGLGISVAVAVGASSIAIESDIVSRCEILVATPGRLVYHVENNDSLDLRHVRYLVLDESDRLLEDLYQEWLSKVLPLLGNLNANRAVGSNETANRRPMTGLLALALVPEVSSRCGSMFSGLSQESVRKFLVSATQTKNPMRLHALDLRQPTFFEPKLSADQYALGQVNDSGTATAKYCVPPSMTEKGWVVKNIQEKPAGLLVLLGWTRPDAHARARKNDQGEYSFRKGGTKLVFTHSVESAHRLCRFLEVCAYALQKTGSVLEMSGDLSSQRRKFVLDTVRRISNRGDKDASEGDRFLIVVCSDVLARGMDMISVDTIINYDAPVHINTYLHRAGRTARAGRPGNVFTLLLAKQAHHFRQMMHEADRADKKVVTKNLTVEASGSRPESHVIPLALQSLRRVLRREKLGLLNAEQSLPTYALHELSSERSHVNDFSMAGTAPEEPVEIGDYLNTPPNSGQGERITKRGREWDTEHQRESHENMDNVEDTDEGLHEDEDDDFSSILYSQMARNLLKAPP